MNMNGLISWVVNTFDCDFKDHWEEYDAIEKYAYAEYACGIYREILERVLNGSSLDEAFNEIKGSQKEFFKTAMESAGWNMI